LAFNISYPSSLRPANITVRALIGQSLSGLVHQPLVIHQHSQVGTEAYIHHLPFIKIPSLNDIAFTAFNFEQDFTI
jgi:hypothetical protein